MSDEERNQMKAAAKVEDLALNNDLTNLDQAVTQMIGSVPNAAAAAAVDANELKGLISAIKAGTASNNQSARFLELATRIGL